MKYSVTLGARVAKDIEVEADSPHEAIAKALADPQAIASTKLEAESLEVVDPVDADGDVIGQPSGDWWEVVAGCEVCSKPILSHKGTERGYAYGGEDSIYVCKDCYASEVTNAPQAAAPEPPAGGS